MGTVINRCRSVTIPGTTLSHGFSLAVVHPMDWSAILWSNRIAPKSAEILFCNPRSGVTCL
jgi:hypothetical protein